LRDADLASSTMPQHRRRILQASPVDADLPMIAKLTRRR
jgi:hypothetical protein